MFLLQGRMARGEEKVDNTDAPAAVPPPPSPFPFFTFRRDKGRAVAGLSARRARGARGA